MTEYIELNRTFSLFKDDGRNQPQTDDDWLTHNWANSYSWEDVLKYPRVAILAAPGAGKTEELKAKPLKLRREGKSAFFCRIELLQNMQLRGCFDIGTEEELNQWLECQDHGYFFLDSVDEGRLIDHMAYERALRNLASAIGSNNFNRITVVLSCRIGVWRANADREKFIEILPTEKTTTASKNYETDEYETSELTDDQEHNNGFIAYTLTPLSVEQIKVFSTKNGANNPDKFIKEIEQTNAGIFASRPQDLLEIITYWNTHGKLGKHEEMLKLNIENKLTEHKPDRKKLPLDDAKIGAELLAAAVTFRKLTDVLLPDAPIGINLRESTINAEKILTKWEGNGRISALLDLAIFDEDIYGTVAFHHRSAREYLAAKWLNRLINDGKSIRAIEGLVFANRYGVDVIIPSLAPLAAWLSLWQPKIASRVIEVAPEALIEHGDPASLSIENRKKLLIYFAKKFAKRERSDVSFDITMMRRLADDALAETVLELLRKHKNNHDISVLLLKLSWQGKIAGISPTALKIALNENSDEYIRCLALDIVSEVGTEKEKAKLADKLLSLKDSEQNSSLQANAIECFYPGYLDTDGLLKIIEGLTPPSKYQTHGINHTLDTILNSELQDDAILKLQKGIHKLITKKPFAHKNFCTVSDKYKWLLQAFITLSNKIFDANKIHLLHSDITYDMLFGLCSMRHYQDLYLHDEGTLYESIRTHKKFLYEFFWFSVKKVRSIIKDEVKSYHQVCFRIDNLWYPHADFLEELFTDLESRSHGHDKQIALSCLFSVYLSEKRPARMRNRMKRSVKGDKKLEHALHLYLNPPPMSEEEKKYKRQNQYWSRQRKQREKRELEHRNKWTNELRNKPSLIRSIGDPSKAELKWYPIWIYEEIKQASDDNHSHFSYNNLDAAAKIIGQDAADNFRSACQDYWRGYNPRHNKNWRTDNSIPWARILSFVGLALEARFEVNWIENLTEKDATRATELGVMELNNFPDWFDSLQDAFPDAVTAVIKEELDWEFNQHDDSNFHPRVLRHLKYCSNRTITHYKPYIFSLLTGKQKIHHHALNEALSLLLGSECEQIILDTLSEKASARLTSKKTTQHEMTWLIALFCIDAKKGFKILRSKTHAIKTKKEQVNFVVNFCDNFINKSDYLFKSNYKDYETADFLREFVPFIYRFVNPHEDNRRKSGVVYSSNRRDNAEQFRSSQLHNLANIPGRATYDALIKVSKSINRDYVLSLAINRAKQDSEFIPWTNQDIATFNDEGVKPPKNETELYQISLSRLHDLKHEFEEGDYSEAEVLKKETEETKVRNFLVNRLNHSSYGQHDATPEDELVDATKPDIRLHYPSIDNAIPIELKIADNGWTLETLKERLKNQVIGQYMRQSKHGVFLLVHNGTKSFWLHPKTKKRINFDDILKELYKYRDSLVKKHQHIDGLSVIGIDLTVRTAKKK